MNRRRARDFEVFSMSFLDTICCAFGAIILLFMLSKFGEPKALEKSRLDLEGRLLQLQEERYDIRGQTEILNRDLTQREQQLSEVKQRLARLRGDLSDVKGQFKASDQDAEVANKLQGQLVSAQQELTEEMKKVLGAQLDVEEGGAVGQITKPLSIIAAPEGQACTFYGSALAEVLRLLTGFEGAMAHERCRARGDDPPRI